MSGASDIVFRWTTPIATFIVIAIGFAVTGGVALDLPDRAWYPLGALMIGAIGLNAIAITAIAFAYRD